MIINTENKEIIALALEDECSTKTFDTSLGAFVYDQAGFRIESQYGKMPENVIVSVANAFFKYFMTDEKALNYDVMDNIMEDTISSEINKLKYTDMYKINKGLELIKKAISVGFLGSTGEDSVLIYAKGYDKVRSFSLLSSACELIEQNSYNELNNSINEFVRVN